MIKNEIFKDIVQKERFEIESLNEKSKQRNREI